MDFTPWVTGHPGGEYNIQKWAEGWEGTEGWYLDFPFEGVVSTMAFGQYCNKKIQPFPHTALISSLYISLGFEKRSRAPNESLVQ